jgi:hypothetical protein
MPMNPRLLRPTAPFGFSPLRIGGLLGWWDATDSSTITIDTGVTEWRDKSGLGQKFSQTTGANQPSLNNTGLGGKPALSFNGSSSWMDLGTNNLGGNTLRAEAGNPLCYYMVCRSASGAAVVKTLLGKGNAWLQLAQITTSVWASINASPVSGPAMPANTDGLLRVELTSGTSGTQSFNSNTDARASVGTTATPAENVLLGTRDQAGSLIQFWLGFIGEILVYNKAISSGERAALLKYFNTKWGLSVT